VLLKIASVGTFLHTGLKLPYGTWFGTQGAGPRTNEGAPLQVGPVPASMYVAMGIGAALNLALGLRPALLYDLLPYESTTTSVHARQGGGEAQILLFTALAFWLLLGKLHAKAMVSVDTDWVYRRLPSSASPSCWRSGWPCRAARPAVRRAGGRLRGRRHEGSDAAAGTHHRAARHAPPRADPGRWSPTAAGCSVGCWCRPSRSPGSCSTPGCHPSPASCACARTCAARQRGRCWPTRPRWCPGR
jgi:hypothetical protein